ncbi:NDR1/HIN1-like protein 6 [Lycium ferocissimum]|uniref:NDR1/HIN1-like protein 6 n=1 Tax=Lycium ferocissimum TaxID=112874 RepID=UPI002815E07E|nr:NDR1/HIN1-like protein 6 [Lycium ferocissimum]
MAPKRRGRNCCYICLAVILLLGLLFLILGLTVFKAKKPITTVNSVSLKDLDVSFDITRLQVHLNITLQADLSVKNPNRVGFKYDPTSATLQYKGQTIGDAPVPAGSIGARETSPMNITLTVMADRLLSTNGLFSDVRSGILPLTTYVKLSGVVRVIFKIHVKTSTTCDLYIDVLNRKLANQTCHYKTKL